MTQIYKVCLKKWKEEEEEYLNSKLPILLRKRVERDEKDNLIVSSVNAG